MQVTHCGINVVSSWSKTDKGVYNIHYTTHDKALNWTRNMLKIWLLLNWQNTKTKSKLAFSQTQTICWVCDQKAVPHSIAAHKVSPTPNAPPPTTGLHIMWLAMHGLGAHFSSLPLVYSHHPHLISTLAKWTDCETKTNQFGKSKPHIRSLNVQEFTMLLFSTKLQFSLHLKSIIVDL